MTIFDDTGKHVCGSVYSVIDPIGEAVRTCEENWGRDVGMFVRNHASTKMLIEAVEAAMGGCSIVLENGTGLDRAKLFGYDVFHSENVPDGELWVLAFTPGDPVPAVIRKVVLPKQGSKP